MANQNGEMGHTYSATLFHVVFSTKERRNAIQEPPKLWAYIAGTARNLNYEPLAIGGTENHVHMLLRLPAHVPVAEAAQKLKANSSRWLGENGTWFGWQHGYGAFSVSPSNVDAVRRYVQNQAEHHRQRSFEDEFVALLAKSGIAFDRAGRVARVKIGCPVQAKLERVLQGESRRSGCSHENPHPSTSLRAGFKAKRWP